VKKKIGCSRKLELMTCLAIRKIAGQVVLINTVWIQIMFINFFVFNVFFRLLTVTNGRLQVCEVFVNIKTDRLQ
jgi:hypothetical protein